jgi:hypothetical protein
MRDADLLQTWLALPVAREVGAEALYELLWVGSFHAPVFARVYRAGEAMVGVGVRGLVEKRGFASAVAWLEAVFKGEPQRVRRELSAQEWGAMEARAEAAGFWELALCLVGLAGIDGVELY